MLDSERGKNRYIPHPYGECFECLIETLEMILLSGCILYILFLFLCLVPSSLDQVRINSFGLTKRPQTETDETLYHGTCEFTWDTFLSGFDISLLFQFIYFLILTLGIRKRSYLWINSILWEITAYILYKIPVLNLEYNKQCWYFVIIVNILIINAISIEVGLLILKYVVKYPFHTNWFQTIKNMIICKGCKCKCFNCCNCKWIFISFNLFFANIINLSLNILFFEYVIWIGINSSLSIITCIFTTFGLNICFAQIYRWIFHPVSCFPEVMLSRLYWMIIVWTIFILEFIVIVFEYINTNKPS